jgi:S-DNA-T family DNA segregation ATPase FtsK/SpoIIIE
MPSIVKRLMQEQHKAMFIELRDCVYDDLPDGAAAPMVSAPPAKAAQPAASSVSTSATQAQVAKVAPKPGAAPATSAAPGRAVPNRPLSVPIQLARPSLIPGAAKPAGAPAPAGAAASAAAASGGAAGSAAKSASMPAAQAAAARGAPAQGAGNVSKPGSSSAALGAVGTASRAAVPVPAPKFVGTPPPMVAPSRLQMQLDAEALDRAAEALLLSSSFGRARGETARRGAGRYQQTVAAKQRPARTPTGRTGFVGEALRGKSLDEVILSYLSDDAGDGER